MRMIFVARKFEHVAGGLERISIDLMNAMVKRGHEVALLTWDRKNAVTHYPLDSNVQWIRLDMGNPDVSAGMYVRFSRLRHFRRFVKGFRPHAILGFQSGAALFSRVATFGTAVKVIAAERVSPDMWRYVRTGLKNKITDIYLLGLADRITVQFPSYIEEYPQFLRKKMVAIHNPVFERNHSCSDRRIMNGKVLLYVARLCFQKNHDLLIKAFSKICGAFQDWTLVLVGDGDYNDRLRNQVADLGLQKRVVFCGAVKDVDGWYGSADLVAFPSLFEGFPNALAESLLWGLPSVGLRKTLGVNSLIEDGVNGLLTEDSVDAFAAGLSTLMDDDDRRIRMSQNAKLIGTRYSAKKTYELWETLIKEVASC